MRCWAILTLEIGCIEIDTRGNIVGHYNDTLPEMASSYEVEEVFP